MLVLIVWSCFTLYDVDFPSSLSTACVERFFSKMKLVKIRLPVITGEFRKSLVHCYRSTQNGICIVSITFLLMNWKKKIWEWMFEALFTILVFDYQISCTLLHKTSVICLNIFHDNIVYVITFSNKNSTNFVIWWEILLNWIPMCFSEKKDLFPEAVVWRCSVKKVFLEVLLANFMGKHLRRRPESLF